MDTNTLSDKVKIEIATKIKNRIENELGAYHVSKNAQFQQVAEEVGKEYGITRNEAFGLYSAYELKIKGIG